MIFIVYFIIHVMSCTCMHDTVLCLFGHRVLFILLICLCTNSQTYTVSILINQIRILLCMCVFVHVRMYTYVCMHVCNVSTYGVCVCLYVCVHVCLYVCMSMCVCVYVCMSVCVYVCWIGFTCKLYRRGNRNSRSSFQLYHSIALHSGNINSSVK